jgi:hypothetical protein
MLWCWAGWVAASVLVSIDRWNQIENADANAQKK